jgi:hypothetical protein
MKKYLLFLLLAGGLLQACSPSKKTGSTSAQTQAATGENDGSSFEKAIVMHEKNETDGVHAEYAWLRKTYPGYTFIKQSLLMHNSKSYDMLEIKTKDGATKDVYFDISGFFGKL